MSDLETQLRELQNGYFASQGEGGGMAVVDLIHAAARLGAEDMRERCEKTVVAWLDTNGCPHGLRNWCGDFACHDLKAIANAIHALGLP